MRDTKGAPLPRGPERAGDVGIRRHDVRCPYEIGWGGAVAGCPRDYEIIWNMKPVTASVTARLLSPPQLDDDGTVCEPEGGQRRPQAQAQAGRAHAAGAPQVPVSITNFVALFRKLK